jgi:lipase
VPLHAYEFGDPAGPPLVCLHGVTGHGQRFRRLGEGPLAGRRVIAPDLRGHGHSDDAPPWSTARHARDALELADSLGIDRADWLGFSFGGRVAAELAAMAPERVRRLALLDPALQLPVEVCGEQARVELEPQVFASADEAIAVRLAAGTLFQTPREMLEEEMEQHLEEVGGHLRYRYSPTTAICAWSEMADDPPPVADVPTLFVRGERSWLPLDPHVERYRERLVDRARFAVVPGSGHSLLWDAFDPTADLLRDFLE